MEAHRSADICIGIGPELPGIGSWDWIGADLAKELAKRDQVVTFRDEAPDCDVLLIVKYKPPVAALHKIPRSLPILFCPVDAYGCCADIDADYHLLHRCHRILLHTERLRKYFQSYAIVEPVEHHLKYVADLPAQHRTDGPILWVGLQSNLPPLVEWVNQGGFRHDLWVLTDLASDDGDARAGLFGFAAPQRVRVQKWTPDRHLAWTGMARAALDIKGTDFRARHKPPAKALDFLASGLPLAMNQDSSSVAQIRDMGFAVANPVDEDHWLSHEYWQQSQDFARRVREQLSLDRICSQFRNILHAAVSEQKALA